MWGCKTCTGPEPLAFSVTPDNLIALFFHFPVFKNRENNSVYLLRWLGGLHKKSAWEGSVWALISTQWMPTATTITMLLNNTVIVLFSPGCSNRIPYAAWLHHLFFTNLEAGESASKCRLICLPREASFLGLLTATFSTFPVGRQTMTFLFLVH